MNADMKMRLYQVDSEPLPHLLSELACSRPPLSLHPALLAFLGCGPRPAYLSLDHGLQGGTHIGRVELRCQAIHYHFQVEPFHQLDNRLVADLLIIFKLHRAAIDSV